MPDTGQLPPRRRPPPEAAGPGTDAPDGSVTYGVDARPNVVVPPARPAWERDADMAAAREHPRCDRCSELPDDLVLALRRALREAKAGGPR